MKRIEFPYWTKPSVLERARADGWSPDVTLPVNDHALYDDRTWWRHADGRVVDEHHLRAVYEGDSVA